MALTTIDGLDDRRVDVPARPLKALLRDDKAALRAAPVALIFAEDSSEIASTVHHHAALGFGLVCVFGQHPVAVHPSVADHVRAITLDLTDPHALAETVNAVAKTASGQWIYYGYNAEYLFFPFCDTRTVSDLVSFHSEERRDAMLCYVVDLYAGDLDQAPDAVSMTDTWLDRAGYYAHARPDPARNGRPMARQLDFFGGLRWRFEENLSRPERRIDRIALFRANRSARLLPDHRFTVEEMNTYACGWHNNLTAAVVSFRMARRLRTDPRTGADIHSFLWRNSAQFSWHPDQLLELGLMEPGQWF